MELQIRLGVNETFDFGIKLYPVGVQADFNILLVNSESFAMSIDPSISTFAIGSGGVVLYAWLPLLMDIVNTEAMTLTVGPKGGLMLGAAMVGTGGAAVAAGGMTGLQIRITESFAIMPEVDAYAVFGDGASAVFWAGAVGFAF